MRARSSVYVIRLGVPLATHNRLAAPATRFRATTCRLELSRSAYRSGSRTALNGVQLNAAGQPPHVERRSKRNQRERERDCLREASIKLHRDARAACERSLGSADKNADQDSRSSSSLRAAELRSIRQPAFGGAICARESASLTSDGMTSNERYCRCRASCSSQAGQTHRQVADTCLICTATRLIVVINCRRSLVDVLIVVSPPVASRDDYARKCVPTSAAAFQRALSECRHQRGSIESDPADGDTADRNQIRY